MQRTLIGLAVLTILFCACSKFEESDTGRFEYGMALLKQGKADDAAEMFKAIDSLYPGSPYGRYGTAVLLEKEYFDIDAAEAFLSLMDDFPDFLPGTRSFVDLAVRLRWYDQAREAVLNAAAIGHDPTDNAMLLAEVSLRTGTITRAGQILDSLMAINPDSDNLVVLYAEYLMHAGRFQEGLGEARGVAARSADNKHNLMKIGKIYAMIGLADSAAVYYSKALALASDDYYFKADLAQAFCDIGYLRQCDDVILELVSMSPGNHREYILRRDKSLAAGEPFEAFRIAMKEVNDHDSFSAKLSYGYACSKIGDIPNTERFYEVVQVAAVHDSLHDQIYDDVTLRMMEAMLEMKNWTEAVLLYGSFREGLERNARSLILFADIHFSGNLDQYTEEFITNLIPLIGNSAMYDAQLGDVYRRADSVEKATEYIDRALHQDALNQLAITSKAKLLEQTKDARAAAEFLKGLDINRSSLDSVYPNVIAVYATAGMTNDAEQFIKQIIDRGPGDVRRYKSAFDFYASLGQKDKMAGIVTLCLENNINSREAAQFAGNYYLANNQPEQTLQLAESVLSREPDKQSALLLKGQALEMQGKNDQAISIYRKLIEEDKLNGAAYGYLARVLIETGGDAREIQSNLSQALKFDNRPLHFITQAKFLIMQEKYNGAVNSMVLAAKRFPESAEIMYYAGFAASKQGDKAKAGEFLKKALSLGLNDSLKTEAEKLIKGL